MAVVLYDSNSPLSPTSINDPVVTETYGQEIRQTFMNRKDALHFRMENGGMTCRIFERDLRPDHILEVEESALAPSPYKKITFSSGRPDKLIGYRKFKEKKNENAWCYSLLFGEDEVEYTFEEPTVGGEGGGGLSPRRVSGREDGVTSFHFVCQDNVDVNVGSDNASSLYREKALHLALKLNSRKSLPFHLSEIFQDLNSRTLRIVAAEYDEEMNNSDESSPFLGETKVSFANDVPSADERYTHGKLLTLGFLQYFLELERELFMNLPPFEEHEDETKAASNQADRLDRLARSLFATIDAEAETNRLLLDDGAANQPVPEWEENSQQQKNSEITPPPPHFKNPESSYNVKFHILGCKNLLEVPGGFGAHPYVLMKDKEGKHILETPTLDDTLCPVWNETNASTTLKLIPKQGGRVTFEVWNSCVAADEFLGCYRWTVADLFEKGNGMYEFPLAPRPGEQDQNVLAASGRLGSISISISFAE